MASPECCEAGPALDPGTGIAPRVLTDPENIGAGLLGQDHNHGKACELAQINGGLMDRFVDGANVPYTTCSGVCSRPENFAYADAATVQPYWDLAGQNALAGRCPVQSRPGVDAMSTAFSITSMCTSIVSLALGLSGCATSPSSEPSGSARDTTPAGDSAGGDANAPNETDATVGM